MYDIWQTKEEVSGTLEAVQNILSITQALQKSKESYNAKCVEQERLKKEGATQREIDKVKFGVLSSCSVSYDEAFFGSFLPFNMKPILSLLCLLLSPSSLHVFSNNIAD